MDNDSLFLFPNPWFTLFQKQLFEGGKAFTTMQVKNSAN